MRVRAAREQATVAEWAQRQQIDPDPDLCLKTQPVDHAARALDADVGVDAERLAQDQVDDLYATIGPLTVERDPRSEPGLYV